MKSLVGKITLTKWRMEGIEILVDQLIIFPYIQSPSRPLAICLFPCQLNFIIQNVHILKYYSSNFKKFILNSRNIRFVWVESVMIWNTRRHWAPVKETSAVPRWHDPSVRKRFPSVFLLPKQNLTCRIGLPITLSSHLFCFDSVY